MRRRFLLAASASATAFTATVALALTAPAASAGSGGGGGRGGGRGGGEHEPWVVRSAVQRTDAKAFRSLCGEHREGAPERRTFPLFGRGKGFTAVEDFQRKEADGTVFWSGHDPKNAENTISVSVIGACTKGPVTLSGVITEDFRDYAYQPLAGRPGWYELQEIDSLALPPSGQGVDTVTIPDKKPHRPHHPGHPHHPPKPGLRAATPNDPAAIDIVVAYTPAAVEVMGSVQAVQSRITYGVNQMNRALAFSNVPASVHVVNTYQTAPTNVPRENVNTLLAMISNPANTVLGATAAAQRNTYGADLVALLASVPFEDSSGAANLPDPGPSATTDANAYSVTSIGSVAAWENLAHEVGHNFGLKHDRLTIARQGGTTPEGTFNYGWVTPNGLHRTLMAYSQACPRACSVVNAYSNTERTWGDQALGNADNNNAAVARQSADTVAAYRASLVTNRNSLTLMHDPEAGGTVRVSEFGPYDPGTQVTVTAVPNPGYRFDAWAVDGIELDGNDPSHQLTMNANRTVNALFVAIEQP
ncbi:reprolysin-like metallopeptidase [Streptomyces sp. NRRL S-87]|uniref:InlB B-repeat-containing protein n=1 Tax=Streptomyces sp. NRRL S-87 TaxID=1463920 RepID=UPI0004C1E9DF|nr:M12 family metallo-peptidase [Streptomyces sp. NRRL S-87]